MFVVLWVPQRIVMSITSNPSAFGITLFLSIVAFIIICIVAYCGSNKIEIKEKKEKIIAMLKDSGFIVEKRISLIERVDDGDIYDLLIDTQSKRLAICDTANKIANDRCIIINFNDILDCEVAKSSEPYIKIIVRDVDNPQHKLYLECDDTESYSVEYKHALSKAEDVRATIASIIANY